MNSSIDQVRRDFHQRLDQLKRDAVDAAVTHHYHIKAVDQPDHDKPGWYSPVDATTLSERGYDVPAGELAFPVPAACPYWYDAERDPRDGAWLRFFVGRAWLILDCVSASTPYAEVVLHFGLSREALDSLEYSVDGVPVVPVHSFQDQHERTHVVLPLGENAENARRRLQISCGVCGVPADLYPGSTDRRRLSVAIGVVVMKESP